MGRGDTRTETGGIARVHGLEHGTPDVSRVAREPALDVPAVDRGSPVVTPVLAQRLGAPENQPAAILEPTAEPHPPVEGPSVAERLAPPGAAYPRRRTIEPIRSAGPSGRRTAIYIPGLGLLLGEPCCAGWLSSSSSRRLHVFLRQAPLLRLPRARPLSAPRQLHPCSCSSMRPTAVRRSSTRGTSRTLSPIWVAHSRLSMRPARRPTRPLRFRVEGWTSGDLFDPNTGEFLGQHDALHAQVAGTVIDSACEPLPDHRHILR